jgi:hypothetical protein
MCKLVKDYLKAIRRFLLCSFVISSKKVGVIATVKQNRIWYKRDDKNVNSRKSKAGKEKTAQRRP